VLWGGSRRQGGEGRAVRGKLVAKGRGGGLRDGCWRRESAGRALEGLQEAREREGEV
jgi:hypothetical protein